MTWSVRAFAGVLLSIVAIVSAQVHADTVQLSVRDGRLSLVAVNATPAQILQAWSRAGDVLIVNADQMPSAPVSITLDNVPEEQALDTLLRPVSGYLARRRSDPVESGSIFDRIVILASSQAARQPAAASPSNAFPTPPSSPRPGSQRSLTNPQVQPQGIPQGPGVSRLVGPDGQPVEDDQAGAPPQPFNPGDAPDTRPRPVPAPVPVPVQPQPQTPQTQQPGSTSAPAGAPRPGMVVPGPQTQQQPQPQQQQR